MTVSFPDLYNIDNVKRVIAFTAGKNPPATVGK